MRRGQGCNEYVFLFSPFVKSIVEKNDVIDLRKYRSIAAIYLFLSAIFTARSAVFL